MNTLTLFSHLSLISHLKDCTYKLTDDLFYLIMLLKGYMQLSSVKENLFKMH